MKRAGNTTNPLLAAKASNEIPWINKVDSHTKGSFAVIAWSTDDVKGEKLLEL
jgi:arsenite-transporting ATPase